MSFEAFKNDLLIQKREIERLGRFDGNKLVLTIGTFMIKKGDKHYVDGSFSTGDPDEFSKHEAETLAFSLGAVVVKSEVHYGRKYLSICDAFNRIQ